MRRPGANAGRGAGRTARGRVAVVTDSTAALPPGVAQRWGIDVVPLDVVVDGMRHAEGVDLAPAGLVAALRGGARVSTSQPAPDAFARAYARAAASGARAVVSVHLSGELSGTVAAARSAAERAPLPVHVVDSRTVAMALGSAVLAAAWTAAAVPPDERFVVRADARSVPSGGNLVSPDERAVVPSDERPGGSAAHAGAGRGGARRGRDVARRLWELCRMPDVRRMPRARRRPGRAVGAEASGPEPPGPEPPGPEEVAAAAQAAAAATGVWFLVDSLVYLRRGGRLSAPAAALGTVLGLRPLLTVADGRLVVAEKIRTRRAALARLAAVAVAAGGGYERVRLVVHHVGEPERAGDLAVRVADELGPRVCEVVVAQAGAVLGAHAGPGLLAVVVSPA